MKYIEILDNKAECPQCFFEGQIISYKDIPEAEPLCTTSWSPHLDSIKPEVTISSIYQPRIDLNQSSEYLAAEGVVQAHLRAINTAKVDSSVCLGDMIPKQVYLDLCIAKANVVEAALKNQIRPENYDHMVKIEKIVYDVSSHDIDFDLAKVRSAKQVNIIREGTNRTIYNTRGSITGRLTTKKGSFPIMTLSTEDRSFIVPTNDLLIEFDFNAAELRVLLALDNQPQPDQDVHEWNRINICRGLTTRKKAKERFFSWLYNPTATDHMMERSYNKSLYKNHYKNSKITTPFGRVMEVDDRRALSYLIQSTSSDVTLEQVYKIRNLLREKRSFIKFLLHDSVILDVSREDLGIMKDLYFAFRETRYGRFKVNVKSGKDFFNMKEIRWKI